MELIYTHTQALPIHTHNVRVRTQNWLNSNIPNTCTLRRKPMHLRDVLYVHKSKKADNEPILDVIQNVEFAEVFFSLLKLTLLLALSIGGCLSSKLKMLKKKFEIISQHTLLCALRRKGHLGKWVKPCQPILVSLRECECVDELKWVFEGNSWPVVWHGRYGLVF